MDGARMGGHAGPGPRLVRVDAGWSRVRVDVGLRCASAETWNVGAD